MFTEHAWLTNVSQALDRALRVNGIGTDLPNLFGLIGFAKNDPRDVTGRVIHMASGSMMGTAKQFTAATQQLALEGFHEDMYNPVMIALDRYPLRPGMACQIIGVTDEGRMAMPPDGVSKPYPRDYILHRLRERGCLLNAIVNQQFKSFEAEGIHDALGVTGNCVQDSFGVCGKRIHDLPSVSDRCDSAVEVGISAGPFTSLEECF